MNKSTELSISIQLIGDKAKTKFISLQHSQLNKQAFVCGKKDVFEIFANDVGRVRLHFVYLNNLNNGLIDLHLV